jgi:hypothetical protein
MSTLHGRTRVDPDGTFRIPLPSECANSEVEYVLEFRAASPGTNGQPRPGASLRRRTGEARRESLRRIAGSIDDPTFQRPPQGEPEPLEPMGEGG